MQINLFTFKKIQQLQIAIMQFGTLMNLKCIDNYFKKCQNESRQSLLKKLYRLSESKVQTLQIAENKIQSDITNVFSYLVQYNQFDSDNKIVKQVCNMFNINLEYICSREPKQRAKFLKQKILEEIQKNTKTNLTQTSVSSDIDQRFSIQNSNPQSSHQFQWVGAKSKFQYLRPMFEQILLQKVKLFDNQLTQLSCIKEDSKGATELMTTARTFHTKSKNNLKSQMRRTVSSADMKNRSKLKKILSNEEEGFCNVNIRDHTQFSLKKWTDKQQKQFRQKTQIFKARQNKIDNIPILFQFVKKYTKTVKARDNIFTKWENRQRTNITPDELRYLCATSLFLNKTLQPSQKFRLKKNVQTVGKRLMSKLEFNIAQKIIQTYKIFLKKVFDLRASYYEQLTDKRKKQYSINKKKSQVVRKRHGISQQFEKDKKMYTTIVYSQKMKIILNPKVYRWVNLFLTNLKKKIDKGKDLRKVQSLKFVNKLNDQQVSPILLSMKKKYPSTKIIIRDNHTAFRPQTKRFVQTQKFYYQKQFQQTISKLNSIKLKGNTNRSFQDQLSGGPPKQHHRIYINLSRKQVKLSSKKCLDYIIQIQSQWRKHYYRKKYESMLQDVHQIQQKQFKQKFQRLFRIYPPNKKINFKVIVNRLKRVSMRINNLAKPYIRTVRKPINLYTSFNKYQFSLNQLKIKYSKLSYRRLMKMAELVQTNQYSKIMQNGYVITNKQINNPICKNGANYLWWAVTNINFQLTKKLLEGGGDPNSKNIEDNTCLHEAMKNGSIDIIFILLDYGADLNIKNNKRVTPLYYGTKKMLKLLGLSDGTTSVINDESTVDNNSIYFRPIADEIYPDHYY